MDARAARGPLPAWAPYGAAALALVASLLLWRALDTREHEDMERAARMAAEMLEAEVSAQVHAIAEDLGRLAAHTELLRDTIVAREREAEDVREEAIAAWRFDAARIVDIHPSTISIEFLWGDLTWRGAYHAPAVAPATTDPLTARPLIPLDLSRDTFEVARASHDTAVSPPFALPDGHVGLRIVAPVFRGAKLDAFISGIVRADDLVASLIGGDAEKYALIVTAGPFLIYPSAARSEPQAWSHAGHVRLPGGADWTVAMTPSGSLRASIDTALPEVFLGAALAISLLLAISLRLARTAGLRTHELGALAGELEERVAARTAELAGANDALQDENARHRGTQAHLARSNEDLRQFAALVSHELRQPLATMQLWSDLLATSHAAALDDEGRECVEKLGASIARMTRLIEAELKLAQVAYADLARERVDLRAVVERLARDFAPQLGRVDGQVEIGDLPLLDADPGQMQQLFRNLIENALKYHRPSVPLVIRITAAGTMAASRDCEIVVLDNGCGFDAADADAIFSIFRRLDDEAIPGSGIGLAICRRIVERHGGSIRAEGVSGGGATFRLRLPVACAAAVQAAAAV